MPAWGDCRYRIQADPDVVTIIASLGFLPTTDGSGAANSSHHIAAVLVGQDQPPRRYTPPAVSPPQARSQDHHRGTLSHKSFHGLQLRLPIQSAVGVCVYGWATRG